MPRKSGPKPFTHCRICGGERLERFPYCWDHYSEQMAKWNLKARRKAGMRPLDEVLAERKANAMTPAERKTYDRDRKKKQRITEQQWKPKCRTETCQAKAFRGVFCRDCAKLRQRAPKPAIVRQTRRATQSRYDPAPQGALVIGPEAFERVKPVDIRGHKVTRIAAVGEWGR
jgi:hypothetical protein